MEREVKRSEPNVRAMAIRMASPRLASQAPRVSKRNKKNVFIWVVKACVSNSRNVSVKIIDSVARSTISRCVRCVRNRIIVIEKGSGRMSRMEMDIVSGEVPVSGLQDQCYLLASLAYMGSEGGRPIINSQS